MVKKSYAERSAESTRRLLDAAISLIAEKGFERTTAAEIGQRAGYSREMVRSRYGTKEALLKSLFEIEYEGRVLPADDPAAPGLEQALAQIDLVVNQARDNPEVLRAFFVLHFETVGPVEILRPWIIDWLARYEGALAAALRRGQIDGSVSGDLHADREADDFMAHAVYRAFLWLLDDETNDYHEALTHLRDRLIGRARGASR